MRHGLDRIDLKILASLQAHARMSNLELSQRVSVAPSTCLARVQRLRDLGYIENDICVVAASKLGPVLYTTLEITLESHNLRDHQRFERAIADIAEVIFAVKVSGRFDYLLVMTTPDMQHLSRLSDELLDGALGIAKLVTVPVLDVAKTFSGFPLDILHPKQPA